MKQADPTSDARYVAFETLRVTPFTPKEQDPMLKRFGTVLFTLLLFSDVTHASESQRLFTHNASLTADALFHAYMSSDPDQRRLSEMYILGVIDSSEGDSWCGYEIASPAAIQEQLYVGLKEASSDTPNERAATAIKSHFNKILPCKKK